MNTKDTLKKTWRFIWHDDSWASWFVNIIIAFILVKFLIYPGLGFMLGTTHPVVAVISGSMEHEVQGFDYWWSLNKDIYLKFDINKSEFADYKFTRGFNKGDLMILMKPKDIKKGDVIVFWASVDEPIIHRVVKINNGTYQTKGDNGITNKLSRFDEINITPDRIIGKASVRVPYLGWAKLAFVELLNKLFH